VCTTLLCVSRDILNPKVMVNTDKKVKFFYVCVALITLQAGFGAYGVVYTKLAKGSKVEPLIFCFYRDGGCAPVLFILSFFLEKKLLVPQVRYEYVV